MDGNATGKAIILIIFAFMVVGVAGGKIPDACILMDNLMRGLAG